VSGWVEAVGKKVASFQKGDEVFGTGQGTCAEYVSIKELNLVHKPANISLEQAAAIPTSALAALQGLRNIGKVKLGQKVLINGASGGVGTFAVQIAKAYGAEVTGVCSTRNLDMVRSIGADHVIDYTQSDFTQSGPHYDLILDQITNHSLTACRSALTPQGKYIPNSGNSGLSHIIKALILSMFLPQQGRTYLSMPKHPDLLVLKELIESGKVKPVIDFTFPLSETAKAFRYMEEVHASGKVLISI
jgi:NADPH:quinone reductase-like Zn-dependent oxidoreductase